VSVGCRSSLFLLPAAEGCEPSPHHRRLGPQQDTPLPYRPRDTNPEVVLTSTICSTTATLWPLFPPLTVAAGSVSPRRSNGHQRPVHRRRHRNLPEGRILRVTPTCSPTKAQARKTADPGAGGSSPRRRVRSETRGRPSAHSRACSSSGDSHLDGRHPLKEASNLFQGLNLRVVHDGIHAFIMDGTEGPFRLISCWKHPQPSGSFHVGRR